MDSKIGDTRKNIFSTYVVIGGGIAGVSCVEQLAVEDPDSSCILISSSPVIKAVRNINKISERIEAFDVEEESYVFLQTRTHCQVFYDTAIDVHYEKNEVELFKGTIIKYEKLCICTGARPKVVVETNPFVIGIRDTETVQTFQEKLSNAKRILVIGNGGIATELVYEIENCEIVWVIKDKSVGATFFDAGAALFFHHCLNQDKKKEETAPSKRMQYQIATNDSQLSLSRMGSALGPDWSTHVNMRGGVSEIRKSVQVQYECELKKVYEKAEFLDKFKNFEKKFPGQEVGYWPIYAELTNDRIYGCDFIISATGVIPNSDFCNSQKFYLADDGGIRVNEQMKTNLPHVFAAGDVCSASWPLAPHWFQMRLWTQARQMGSYAARCMVGDRKREPAILDICFDLFTHVTRFFGYKVILLGLYNGQRLGADQKIIVRVSERTEYCKVILQNSRVQGAILIGETDLEETFENLILNQLDVSSLGEDILSPVVDIEDYFD